MDEKFTRIFIDIIKELICPEACFIAVSHTDYIGNEDIISIPIFSENINDPIFSNEELSFFLKKPLEIFQEGKALINNDAYYNEITGLLNMHMGQFPGVIVWVLKSYLKKLRPKEIIQKLKDINTIYEVDNDITKYIDGIYADIIGMLSDSTRKMLFVMLNFPPPKIVTIEDMVNDLETTMSLYFFEDMLNKIQNIFKFLYKKKTYNELITELCNKNILYKKIEDSKTYYYIDDFSYDVIMNCKFNDKSVNRQRVKYTNPRFTLVTALKSNPTEKIIRIILNIIRKRNKKKKEVIQIDDLKPLHLAAEYDVDPNIINILIEKGNADINFENEEGQTPLHIAAEYSSKPDAFDVFKKKKADFEKTDIHGGKPFYYAVTRNENTNVIQWFLNNGFKDTINTETFGPSSNLMHYIAARNQNPEVIPFLVSKGYQIEVSNDWGITPFHIAAAFNNIDVVNSFLLEKYNLNATTKYKETILHFAAAYNKINVVKILCKNEFYKDEIDNENDDGLLPLHFAAMKNSDPLVIEHLVKKTKISNINTEEKNINYFEVLFFFNLKLPEWVLFNSEILNNRNINSYNELIKPENNKNHIVSSIFYENKCEFNFPISPVILSIIFNGNIRVLHWYLENGFKFDENYIESYLLHYASAFQNNFRILEKLLDSGFNINKENTKKQKPIHFAAAYNKRPEITNWFFTKLGINNIKDNDDIISALFYAAESNTEYSILECFFKIGYQENYNENEITLLHYSARYNSTKGIIRYLIEKNIDNLRIRDNLGYTPLMYMAQYYHSAETIKMCIEEYKSPPYIHTHFNNGYTLLHLAVCDRRLNTANDINNIDNLGKHFTIKYTDEPCYEIIKLNKDYDEEKIIYLNELIGCNTPAKNGITPLHITAKFQELYFLQLFNPTKDDLEITDDFGNSTIHFAAQNDYDISVIKWLIEAQNINVNIINNFGISPAHIAANYNHQKTPDMFIYLAQKGADLGKKYSIIDDNDITIEKTPLDYAKERPDWNEIEPRLKAVIRQFAE